MALAGVGVLMVRVGKGAVKISHSCGRPHVALACGAGRPLQAQGGGQCMSVDHVQGMMSGGGHCMHRWPTGRARSAHASVDARGGASPP